jgi:IclR family pca regulon transcriptional regulator
MGRLLLGALSDGQLEAYLERLEPLAVTDKTVTDKQELKRRIVATRRSGWSYINGEVEARVAGLSVPLRDREGRATAALNMSLLSENQRRPYIERTLLPRLREAAVQIERILHHGLPARVGRG